MSYFYSHHTNRAETQKWKILFSIWKASHFKAFLASPLCVRFNYAWEVEHWILPFVLANQLSVNETRIFGEYLWLPCVDCFRANQHWVKLCETIVFHIFHSDNESISVWEFVRQMEMTTKWNCVWHLTGETDEIKLWFLSSSLAPAGGVFRLIRFIYKFEIKFLWIDDEGASECDALSFRLTDIDVPTSYV